jgi:hypothetical protein
LKNNEYDKNDRLIPVTWRRYVPACTVHSSERIICHVTENS